MSITEWTDRQVIMFALLQWRNHIETGDYALSAQDAIRSGQSKLCKALEHEQILFIRRLEKLAEKIASTTK